MLRRNVSVRDEIIKELSQGPRKKLELRNAVVEDCDVTPQAFYKIFNTLKKEEVLTVSKDIVNLSAVWVRRELNRIRMIADVYDVSGHRTYIGSLGTKGKKTYRFKTLRELDLFWVHIILMTMQDEYRSKAIISLLPHHWFDILRPETNAVWYQLLGEDVPHFTILTHATSAEKLYMAKNAIKKNELMFGENPLKQAETTYFNIIDDLVFEARVDIRVVSGIRSAMQGKTFNRERLLDTHGDFRLIIERNRIKTDTVRKKIQKYFTTSLV